MWAPAPANGAGCNGGEGVPDLASILRQTKKSLDKNSWSVELEGQGEGKLDGRISYTCTDCGHCIASLQFVMDAPSALAGVMMPRPEVLSKHRNSLPTSDQFLQIGDVLSQRAPGDAVVSCEEGKAQTFLKLWSVLLGMQLDKSTGEDLQLGDIPRANCVVWRDHPEDGQLTFAMAPVDQETFKPVRHAEAVKNYIITFSPHPILHDQVLVTHMVRVPGKRFPAWASDHFARLVARERQVMTNYLCSPEMDELRKEDELFYVVINLKSCPRGPPLLPQQAQIYETLPDRVEVDNGEFRYWARAIYDGFSLRSYMMQLLPAIGCPDVQVYDEMEGRQLVPYQAVVPRSQWENVKARFQEVFRVQQSAYRKLNGGTSAPKMAEDGTPRWATVPDTPPLEKPCKLTMGYYYEVRNTFVEMVLDDEPVCVSCEVPSWRQLMNNLSFGLVRENSF